MTEKKRFECDKGSRIIIDNESKLHYIMTLDWECSLVTKLLNRFAEENEQLKEQNKELKQDNDIKFWKLQLMEQWNNTELISHELYLAIENGYEISDEFKKHLDGLKKKHEEHMKKAERLGI